MNPCVNASDGIQAEVDVMRQVEKLVPSAMLPVSIEAPAPRTDLGLAHEAPTPLHAPAQDVRPSHRVPPGFRGPPPQDDDAEDTAPMPWWVPHSAAGAGSLGTVPNVPMNKNGWRYVAAGPAAHRLPRTVYHTLDVAPACVHWSWQDRSAFTRISQDASIVGTDKGYRSARANVGVRHGAWYVEMQVLPPDASSAPAVPMRDGPHVRLGWARREASLNAPVGWDAYSYGVRDQNGACVTQSRLVPYGRAFGPGDVVGMYIRLPEAHVPPPPGTEHGIAQKRIPIRYKGQLYFESLEYAPSREMEALMEEQRRSGTIWTPQPAHVRPLPTLHDSCIGFVVNGEPQGMAFANLYDYRPLRTHKKRQHEVSAHASVSAILKSRQNALDDGMLGYYCMASMYGGARVRIIASDFVHPPPPDLEDRLWRAGTAPGVSCTRQHPAPPWRPLADRYAEVCQEAWELDEADDRAT